MGTQSDSVPESTHTSTGEIAGEETGNQQQKVHHQTLTVRVNRVGASGAMVIILPNGEKAWMPAQEMFPSFKPHDDFREVGGHLASEKIEVIEYGKALDGKKLVSHIRVENDPWDEVATWEDKCVKVMEVTALTEVRAVGIIPPGIRAVVKLESLREAFPLSWRGFAKPLPGDEIAGLFHKDDVDDENRIVTLNVLACIRSSISIQDILAQDVGSSEIHSLTVREEGNTNENLDMRGIETILVIEDDKSFGNALADLLKKEGSEVLRYRSYEDASNVISSDEHKNFDLAIVDVHLTASVDDYLGIKLASELKSRYPECRIILMSMEDVDASCESVKAANDLRVSTFVPKPFTVAHLYEAFADVHKPPRPISEVLPGGQPREFVTDDTKGVGVGFEKLNEVAHRLRTSTDAEAVVLFSIDPSSYEVRIVVKSDPTGKYSVVRPRLDCSPIRDAAMDGEMIYESNASNPWKFPKHRYLQKAYGYESCIGMNVRRGRGSPLAYAVFAFHSSPSKFTISNRESVKLAAHDFGFVLQLMAFKEELGQMKPFELMGKAYGSLAHDIGNSLTTIGIHLKRIKNLLEKKRYSDMDSIIKDLRNESKTTTQIVNLFKAMAKGKNRTIVDFALDETITDVVEYFNQLANMKYSVSVKFVCHRGADYMVMMPEGTLEQLMYNLLLNAAQQIERLSEALSKDSNLEGQIPRFKDEKQGEIIVELERTKDDKEKEWIVVLVHDTGPGIHRCDFDRVFDLHFTTKEEGCGMGLDICKNLVQMVHLDGRSGSLRIRRSVLFVGTTFEVKLPVR